MTTANLRTAARQAEKALDWSAAADLYARAAAAYPVAARRNGLAERDIAGLNTKSEACRRMAAA